MHLIPHFITAWWVEWNQFLWDFFVPQAADEDLDQESVE